MSETLKQRQSKEYELTKRILALIPAHPEIMTIESPFDLFAIDGFQYDDIGPSLAQAGRALGKARLLHKATMHNAGNQGQTPQGQRS